MFNYSKSCDRINLNDTAKLLIKAGEKGKIAQK